MMSDFPWQQHADRLADEVEDHLWDILVDLIADLRVGHESTPGFCQYVDMAIDRAEARLREVYGDE